MRGAVPDPSPRSEIGGGWRSADATPRTRGLRMPAEWCPHEATWLSWPTNEVTWPGWRLEAVREAYVEMIRWLALGEEVRILVDDQDTAENLHLRLEGELGPSADNVTCWIIPTVDAWIRDYGPNFLKDESNRRLRVPAANRWRFNAWGGKYPELAVDDGVCPRILERLNAVVFEPGIVLEGGSIDVNGQGLCLTTRQCLLHPNRNPELSPRRIEEYLTGFLGAKRILWLEEGIIGDDTDGHVDDIARFVAVDQVLVAYEPDPADGNHSILQDAVRRLETWQQEGLFRVTRLPMPEPVLAEDHRLPASYANFYIANRTVFAPVFGCSRDREALSVLQSVFPGRQVVGIPARDMVYGLGAVHCLTQQQPVS